MPNQEPLPKPDTAEQPTDEGLDATPCSPSSEEEAFLKRINAAKPGTLIKVRMWTDECGSSHEQHAKSITAAVKIIRQFSKFNANWSLEFISEANETSAAAGGERKDHE
jgi:hypothetical protein